MREYLNFFFRNKKFLKKHAVERKTDVIQSIFIFVVFCSFILLLSTSRPNTVSEKKSIFYRENVRRKKMYEETFINLCACFDYAQKFDNECYEY